MQSILKRAMFSDIDIPALEISDLAISYPGMTEAFLRLYTAYREEQLARVLGAPGARRRRITVGCRGLDANDPVAEVGRFLATAQQ